MVVSNTGTWVVEGKRRRLLQLLKHYVNYCLIVVGTLTCSRESEYRLQRIEEEEHDEERDGSAKRQEQRLC